MAPKLGVEELRKKQIVEAATRCIIERGLHNFSIKDLVEEAGISAGNIYYYFRNKDEILVQVLRQAFSRSHNVVMETESKIEDFWDKMRTHIKNINHLPMDAPDFYPVYLNFLGQLRYEEEISQLIRKFLRNLRSYVDAILNMGVAQGYLREEQKQNIAAVMIATGMGLGVQHYVDPEAVSLQDIDETFTDIFISYLQSLVAKSAAEENQEPTTAPRVASHPS